MREIKSISFAGGGAMGTTYPGVYLALVYTGIFEQLEHVAGSSAGSIVASMLSVGMPALQFRDLMMKNGVDKLLGTPVESNSFFKALSPRSGIPIFEFVHSNINNRAKEFLEKHVESHYLKLALQAPGYELTFGDLNELHKLSPRQFKKLKLTATAQSTGKLEYFCCKTTPDVGVARACQASCAIPGILEKVTIKDKAYFDGGLRNNAPVDGFEKEKTLGIDFGIKLDNQRNHVFQALYTSRANEVSNEKRFEELLKNILNDFLLKQDPLKLNEIVQKYVNQILLTYVPKKPITLAEKEELDEFVNMLTSAIKIELRTKSNFEEKFTAIKALIDPVFYHSKPAILYSPPPKLYKPGIVDILYRDWYIPRYYVPNHDEKNTEIKQKTMEKIFSEYALQYVEIRIGNVGVLDFSKANQFYRTLNAIGFLDSLNYIANHEVENPLLFDQTTFYEKFIENFIAIYKATLVSSGVNYNQDPLLTKILSGRFLSKREQYYFIRESLEIELHFPWYLFYNNIDYSLDSPQGFALTRAFEYTNKIITDHVLFEEINNRRPQRSLLNLFGLLSKNIQKTDLFNELRFIIEGDESKKGAGKFYRV